MTFIIALIVGTVILMGFMSIIALIFIDRLPQKNRMTVFVIISILLLTPSVAPVTIAAIPVPLGALIFAGIMGGFLHELPRLIAVFWVWHIIAFPITGLIFYFVGAKVFGYGRVSKSAT